MQMDTLDLLFDASNDLNRVEEAAAVAAGEMVVPVTATDRQYAKLATGWANASPAAKLSFALQHGAEIATLLARRR